MRVVVTGAGGMLAREVIAELARSHTVIPLDRRALDVTDASQTAAALGRTRPDWVVHCAAYTKVDQAEAEPARAYAVNGAGTRHVAVAARTVGARVAYVSTDYVFDGTRRRPWREDDPAAPVNAYGLSKLAGEDAVREALPDSHLIVRTQWLYGHGGPNFVSMILRKAADGETVNVVNDQTGAPTNARDLSHALHRLVAAEARGTIHVANGGQTSWFDFARYVLDRAGVDADLRPCTSQQLGRPARRPAYSVLDCSRFEELTGGPMRPWQDAVDTYLRETLLVSSGPPARSPTPTSESG